MSVENFLTHVKNEEDLPYLDSVLFDVNMRLYNNKKNPNYRRIIQSCCRHIEHLALTQMEGYSKPFGMSGANVGIPFNIIGIVRNRNTKKEFCQIMINPVVIDHSKESEIVESNCGSIRLKERIRIPRWKSVTVAWYDEEGNEFEETFDRYEGGYTIQHEIDHNNGVLITDLKIKDTEDTEETAQYSEGELPF